MTNILTVPNPASLVYAPDPPNPVASEIAQRVQGWSANASRDMFRNLQPGTLIGSSE